MDGPSTLMGPTALLMPNWVTILRAMSETFARSDEAKERAQRRREEVSEKE